MTRDYDFSLIDQFIAPDGAAVSPELGRNFRAVARGIAGHEGELAERRSQAATALKLQERFPVLSEAGALQMAEKGRWVL